MTPNQVAAKLRQFNEWRRDDDYILPQPDPREIGLAIDAAIEMIESAEEASALCDKLADILTRTANVLKGEPKPLHRHSWHDLPNVAQRLVAAPSAQPAPSIPEGWKLVPIEPTPEMIDAAEYVDWGDADVRGSCINAWDRMLAAAPEAKP